MQLQGVLLLGMVVYACIPGRISKNFCSKFCFPGEDCWPVLGEFAKFGNTLDAVTSTPFDPKDNFTRDIQMKNTYVTRFPYAILYVKSITDIQQIMLFAKRANLRVSIQSSGHDYIGRSTGDGTIQINLSYMKKVTINLNSTRHPDGEITAESGNTWHRIYREADAVGRVIIGGSAQTVGMGGYNMGGGHSPMSRKLGLAVDNLLEVQMVTVDGQIVTVNGEGTHSTDKNGHRTTDKDDLFWALRGGGGGTFGVVVSFTMKLHNAPNGFVGFERSVAMVVNPGNTNLAKPFLKFYGHLIAKAPNEWSGYLLMSATPVPGYPTLRGILTVALIHFGDWSSPSRSYMEALQNYQPTWGPSSWKNYSSFMDYKGNYTDPIYYRNTLANTLVQEDNLDGFANLIGGKAYGLSQEASFGCTLVALGGKTKEKQSPDVTSVNSALRTAVFSSSCGSSWSDPAKDEDVLKLTTDFNRELQNFGTGVYLNEPAAVQDHWKTAFWGDASTYNRLLAVKKKYDPTNFLKCLYCVGSDLDDSGSGGNVDSVPHNVTHHTP